MSSKTSLNVEENVEAALSYVGIFITGIIILALEKESEFVRFHALQSTITFLGLILLGAVFRVIPIIGWVFNTVVTVVALIAWILGIIKAYQGEKFKFPIAGDLAESWLPKVNI
ncbi:hypothetical protein DRN82_03560 [Thermococci archaeon]|nr:MAG: hypothetical protein DRN82_03560 [Thermococci archaeon]